MTTTRPRLEEALQIFERHRTVRQYADARIPETDLARILQAGRRAPTDATGFMYAVIRVADGVLHARMVTLWADP